MAAARHPFRGRAGVSDPLDGTDEVAPESPALAEPSGDDQAAPPGGTQAATPSRSPRASQGETPLYKGEPLDSERGPGLGCFWVQSILLGIFLVLTPLTVAFGWPEWISAGLLILTLVLLLFTGQTVIFLLRLVAADRRGRRTPRAATARKTVGMIEDESATPTPEDASVAPEAVTPDAVTPDGPSH